MSRRTDARAREVAMTVARMAKAGNTSRQIADIMRIDVKRVPTLRKLGETLLTIHGPSHERSSR